MAALRDDVEVAVLEENSEPAGFFPFRRARGNVGLPIAGRMCDFQGMIARPGTAWTARSLLRACGLSALHFCGVPLAQAPLQPYCWAQANSPYMDLSAGFEAYQSKLRGQGSTGLLRAGRKARKLDREIGPLRFEPDTREPPIFRALIRWKLDQYRRTKAVNYLAEPWKIPLLESLLRFRGHDFAAMLSALYAGDHLVAVHLGLCSRGVLHGWFPAYNPDFAGYSPGQVMWQQLAQGAQASGIRRIDLGPGDERYKVSLMTGAATVGEGSVDLRHLRKWACRSWFHTCEWIRSSPLRTLRAAWRATRGPGWDTTNRCRERQTTPGRVGFGRRAACSAPAPRGGTLALADQVIVSAANFLSGVIIGRQSKAEFGLYWLGLSVVLFATTLQTALIATPYMIYSPRLDGPTRRRYAGSTFTHELGFSALVAIGFVLGGTSLTLGMGPAELAPVMWALAGVAIFLLLRDYVRQILFANLQVKAAVVLDACASAVQLAGLGCMAFYGRLSAAAACWIVGGASGVVTFGWLLRQRGKLVVRAADVLNDLRHNWASGKWVFASGLAWALTVYLYPWVLLGFHGPAANGAWAACFGILSVANPLVLGIQNYLGPSIAHCSTANNRETLRRHVVRAAAAMAALLLPLTLALMVVGGPVVVLVYGGKYAGNEAAICWLALALFVSTVTFAFSRALFVLEQAQLDFWASLVGLACLPIAGTWLAWKYDVAGAALGLLLGNVIGLAMRYVAFARHVHHRATVERRVGAAVEPPAPSGCGSTTAAPAPTAPTLERPVNICVIICTYNRCQMLKDALESLLAQETGGRFSYEIVVLDDASTDDTRQVAEAAAGRSPVAVR